MRKVPYSHLELAPFTGTGKARVVLSKKAVPNCPDALRHALAVMRLAELLGIGPENEDLVLPAPLLTMLCGRRMFFLRGWKQYESCVKGFNALGLLAEHAAVEQRRLERLSPAAKRRAKLEFLASRLAGGRKAFSRAELAALPKTELDRVDLFCLALWRTFARRRIVCSTSSNLGISLHQALRGLQSKELVVAGKRFPLLGAGEGELLIWCPDERADFMSADKAAVLRALAAEKPKLTSLHPYVNRQQRDPGALKAALESGGYFFPTNPQSRSELQNLLTLALEDLEASRGVPCEKLLLDPRIRQALESLGAAVEGGRVVVRSALEGGLFGMAAPYLILLEETLRRGGERAVCVWNPASIGAALSALALCDAALRSGRSEPGLREFFPLLAAFLKTRRVGRDLATRIHGVFDIANLQSLAQLFGVVVRRHLSGRGTAYVGLGSSSYANGNLCYDVLRESSEKNGGFRGRDHLHPATHALNPVAQALVYAEDLRRVTRSPGFSALGAGAKVRLILERCRKPEPAGAAALAGYLLARLDAGTLSFIEIAYSLRAGGFTKAAFLRFGGFDASRYVQQAGEEGAYMESFARGVLEALGWDRGRLSRLARSERSRSRRAYLRGALDDAAFEALDPAVHINLTGDNCPQPSATLVAELLRSYEWTKSVLDAESIEDRAGAVAAARR